MIAYILPTITSLVVTLTFIIIATNKDKFLAQIEINQLFAIRKILKFLLFFIITLMCVLVISLQLAEHYNMDVVKILSNPNERFYYISLNLTIVFMISMLYLGISTSGLKSRTNYYIKNYDHTGRDLYILQKHQNKYICTFDEIENANRIIIDTSKIENVELHVSYEDSLMYFDFTNLLNIKNKKLGSFLFVFILIFLFILILLFNFIIFILNVIVDFGSSILLTISILIILATLVAYLVIFIRNLKKKKFYK
ncbi:hypothetical protein PYI52_06090 [Staphylococcus epidermidis]|uniref:hypothetical protein n=1 Tax=Staphylococcus epidermidis TaxID=1282 RepID=UPI0024803DED|nr:hypothetical protein [Staphylococcus epidermidis]MDH8743034.1 hypothetical protein [Staphylococcus epidermidis]MDH8750128.1 hypothetical protein [Staphylococcus epidermidis]MDH8819755.1 hypothetical protein [Staphylococcus epidermidis]MDH8894001.1 hypothetical protein [Staphylococcus epidermidis]MDS3963913.1 hypothetical protein [Staphylococcus epidermidis]